MNIDLGSLKIQFVMHEINTLLNKVSKCSRSVYKNDVGINDP